MGNGRKYIFCSRGKNESCAKYTPLCGKGWDIGKGETVFNTIHAKKIQGTLRLRKLFDFNFSLTLKIYKNSSFCINQ